MKSLEEELLYLHWHEELEFLMLKQGKASFRVGMKDYALQTGEAIFVNSGLLHSGSVLGDELCSFVAFVFHAKLFGSRSVDLVFDKYIDPLIHEQIQVPVHIRRTPGPGTDLLDLLEQIEQANREQRWTCEMETMSLLMVCLTKLLAMGGPAMLNSQSYNVYQIERLKLVVDYIERNFTDPIKLKQLAELARTNESYFCRFFKKMTNQSPIEYLNAYRLRRAAILLQQSDLKIMHVAMDVGFNSLGFFNRLFRQRFGCTPGEYRKRKKQNIFSGNTLQSISSS
jgi:AraC-like DNA-binding protein